jgi:hypothetical protein
MPAAECERGGQRGEADWPAIGAPIAAAISALDWAVRGGL